ncbi:MAG: hypothetical protein JW795_17455 [Chitinivibrionales bacterium]|nr:hypothetical protein [Chitinivibrionales bacterium]
MMLKLTKSTTDSRKITPVATTFRLPNEQWKTRPPTTKMRTSCSSEKSRL